MLGLLQLIIKLSERKDLLLGLECLVYLASYSYSCLEGGRWNRGVHCHSNIDSYNQAERSMTRDRDYGS